MDARPRAVPLRPGALAAALGLSLGACLGAVPSGGSCSSSSDCESGLQCLYPLGSGCNAGGTCAVPTSDCGGTVSGLVVCGCGGTIDLACIPSSAALPIRSETGPACVVDAGTGASDSGDAG